jgi:hypothetical protein
MVVTAKVIVPMIVLSVFKLPANMKNTNEPWFPPLQNKSNASFKGHHESCDVTDSL